MATCSFLASYPDDLTEKMPRAAVSRHSYPVCYNTSTRAGLHVFGHPSHPWIQLSHAGRRHGSPSRSWLYGRCPRRVMYCLGTARAPPPFAAKTACRSRLLCTTSYEGQHSAGAKQPFFFFFFSVVIYTVSSIVLKLT